MNGYIPDWWPEGWDGIDPPGVLAGFDGAPERFVPHRDGQELGWRCSCGAPTLGPTESERWVDPGHRPVPDVQTVADPNTPMSTLFQWPVWSEAVLEAFLARQDLSGAVRRDLVALTTDWTRWSVPAPDVIAHRLLSSTTLGLDAGDLAAFTDGDGVREPSVALAMLEHPAADGTTLAALVVMCSRNLGGTGAFAQVEQALRSHAQPRVRVALELWWETTAAQWACDNEAHTRAQVTQTAREVFTSTVMALDAAGPDAWAAALELSASYTGPMRTFGDFVAAVVTD